MKVSGTLVMMPAWVLSRDADNFENPDDFVPERFEEGNKVHDPYAWIPFGYGQRSCIGTRLATRIAKYLSLNILNLHFLFRFAYEKMKCAFAHVFREMEFYKAPETPAMTDVEYCVGTAFLFVAKNMIIGLRPRTDKKT